MGTKRRTSYADDLRERLKDPEYAAEYLNAVLNADDGDQADAAFLLALRNVAEAFQMSEVAHKADLNRENLYRMLSGRGNPKLSSLFAILRVLGLKFSVEHKTNGPVTNGAAKASNRRASARLRKPPAVRKTA